ncbi:hypothetical protein [Pseudochrobactrum sp. MP213Fo]|uniref:hypothetical protein n=1 Tax=Pseudochrobactrum sp. MP213Fo TaxID=3022250 RepID=UPI003BA0A6B7
MSDILKAYKLIEAIRELEPLIDDFDDVRDDIDGAEGRLTRLIMSSPANTADELKIKLLVWRMRIEDPMMIHDRDVPLWDDLTTDIGKLTVSAPVSQHLNQLRSDGFAWP